MTAGQIEYHVFDASGKRVVRGYAPDEDTLDTRIAAKFDRRTKGTYTYKVRASGKDWGSPKTFTV